MGKNKFEEIVFNFCVDSHLMYSLIACSQQNKCDKNYQKCITRSKVAIDECMELPRKHYSDNYNLRCSLSDWPLYFV